VANESHLLSSLMRGEIGHICPTCPIFKDNDDKETDADKTNAPPKSSKHSKSVDKKKKKTSFAQPSRLTKTDKD
jgi:hypothetical protein